MRLFNKNKEEKEETLDELRAKDSTYEKGVAGGITGTAVGGLTAGLGYLAGRFADNPKNAHLNKISTDKLREAKGIGLGVAGAGLGLTAASAIKRRKVRKKIKQKEENVNTEKEK